MCVRARQLSHCIYVYASISQFRGETWLWQCSARAVQFFFTSDCSAVARIRYKNISLAVLIYFSPQGLTDEETRGIDLERMLVYRS